MNWFYSANGQQLGPVSDSQLEELFKSGTINRDTLVWREGMKEWQPFGTARPGGPPPVAAGASAGTVTCAECGRSFAPADVILLNGTWVCAKCKPIFLQKMTEGVAPISAAGMWRMDKQLVTVSETPFPDRCVKCNAPVHGFRLKRVLYWQHPAYYLLILCNLLILLIVVLIVRKKAVLHVGICEEHLAKRKRDIMIGWGGSLGGIALAIIGGFAFKDALAGIAIMLGIVMFLVCTIYGLLKAPMISAAKITKENVYVKGVHRDFLAGLPEWPGA